MRGPPGRRLRLGSRRGGSVDVHQAPTGSGTARGRRRRRGTGADTGSVGTPAPASGPRGQHGAEGHHAAADPQPEGHRLDDHAERDRRAALLGQPGDGEVDVLPQPGPHRGRADERPEARVLRQGGAVHLRRRRSARSPSWRCGCVSSTTSVRRYVISWPPTTRVSPGSKRASISLRKWPLVAMATATITTPMWTIMPPLVRPTNPRHPCRRVASTTWRSAAPPANAAKPEREDGAQAADPEGHRQRHRDRAGPRRPEQPLGQHLARRLAPRAARAPPPSGTAARARSAPSCG